MSNFVLLYAGGGMPATEAEQKKELQDWQAWYGKLDGALIDGGDPFTPMAKNIGKGGVVKDGPVGTPATGYSIVKADSLNSAVELAKGCPVLRSGGQISVYETFKAM